MKEFTQKDLSLKWGCNIRTVRRRLRRFPMEVSRLTGNQPVFSEKEVKRVEKLEAKTWAKKQAMFRRFGRIGRMSAARRGTR